MRICPIFGAHVGAHVAVLERLSCFSEEEFWVWWSFGARSMRAKECFTGPFSIFFQESPKLSIDVCDVFRTHIFLNRSKLKATHAFRSEISKFSILLKK